ncbi:MAG: radical SAM family heme chaperone HemW [Oscillospiraceae bacterium]|nr:radical SAM family heme chaperone HemW [Oscillospiraceae bacterium]
MALFSKLVDKTPLGIYIHVPFCRSKCQYCDFYSITTKDDHVYAQFTDAICQHVKEAGALAPTYRVDTIYFGGGTPTFFGAEGMAMILAAIRRSFDVAGDAEITFEANPDSVTEKLLRRLKAEGFNRVSMGVQSDDDTVLRRLGRPHTYAQAVLAAQRIRKAGLRNVSIDLMYGLPGQTLEAWQDTLQHVLSMNPDHISCYGLKVEERTPLWHYKDTCGIPDDETQADMYLTAVEFLKARGYRQYEISNFAKKGLISRHNTKYWMGGEYLGFGPDASSDFGGKRFTFVRDVHAYIEGIRTGGSIVADVQEIPPRERAGEYLMTRLRTTTGISQEEYEKQYLLPFAPLEENLVTCANHGLARKTPAGRWFLTPEGMLVSNSIISDLLLIQDQSQPLTRRPV